MEFGLQIMKVFMELSFIYAGAYIVTRYTGWFGVGVETVGVLIMLIIEGWIFYAAAMTNMFDETVAMMLIVWGASILMAIIGGVNGFVIRRHVKRKKEM